MIIISDTTPLRYLIEIEAAHILPKLFGKVIIPEKIPDKNYFIKSGARPALAIT